MVCSGSASFLGPRQAPQPGPTSSPSTRVNAKPLEPGPRQAPRSGSSPSPSNRAHGKHLIQPLRMAHLPRREQFSKQAGLGTHRPSFADLRQGMRMGSDSPERRDFGPVYHSREGRVMKGRSWNLSFAWELKWVFGLAQETLLNVLLSQPVKKLGSWAVSKEANSTPSTQQLPYCNLQGDIPHLRPFSPPTLPTSFLFSMIYSECVFVLVIFFLFIYFHFFNIQNALVIVRSILFMI